MEQRVKKIMAKTFKTEEKKISENASMDTLEEWDSLRHMYLILGLEDEFGVEFSQPQIINMLSYKTILFTLKEVVAGSK